ncbi:MAG: ABC transporter ATP-binding protein [Ardenticatenaceae bacterium]|nr:ABC transporter ATP-binding protein [Ardenticatenaceae bacterium]
MIKVENLGKSYQIRHKQERYTALRDVLTEGAKNTGRRLLGRGKTEDDHTLEEFWALQDVSFEVKQGERLGIIGRNGAGKSTLLKVLSRITEPTRGEVRLRGRVASLLEVGTGFHPELTGRENIYLNGAILGMSKVEIDRKFDEIVAFAEVEKFLDTPVKRYSSGMYVRLAFAVAAYLDVENLLIDEVLAVGDAGFQKRSLGRMSEITQDGRTVLFVSHNMAAVASLCDRCVHIEKGRIVDQGQPNQVITRYLDGVSQIHRLKGVGDRDDRMGSGEARFTALRLLDHNGEEVDRVPMGSSITLEVTIKSQRPINEPVIGFLIVDKLGNTILRAYSHESYAGPTPRIRQEIKVRCCFSKLPLMYGVYSIHLWLGQHKHPVDYLEYAASLEIIRSDVYATGHAPDANNGGLFIADHSWEFAENE